MAASNEQAGAAQAQIRDPLTDLDDETVREYLKNNHDFLDRNPDMLDYRHVPHASGSAISLVEKPVSVLRERNMEMRRRLTTLTSNARENDHLFEQTRKLVLQLLEAASVEELYASFMGAMRDDFEVEFACMLLYGEHCSDDGCRFETRDSTRAEIGALFRGNKAVCGTLRSEELQFLFPDCKGVGSAALVPLINDGEYGLIAVGSADANRYNTSIGTLFLTHIAEVMVRLLPRLLPPPPVPGD